MMAARRGNGEGYIQKNKNNTYISLLILKRKSPNRAFSAFLK